MKKMKSKTKKILVPIILLAIALFLVVWYTILVPVLTTLSEEYFFTAETTSFDNFYDEENGKYAGLTETVGIIEQSLRASSGDKLNIVSTFSIKSLGGEEIASFEKEYIIDRYTRKAITKNSLSDDAYLFGPLFMNKDSFKYEHINYDLPVEMVFESEEVINGLKVYKFNAQYQGEFVDQSDTLTSLEGVPEERGVRVEPELEVWFEPVTGAIIKYHDKAQANFFDRQTRESIVPWNAFENHFSRSSVVLNIENAKQLRNKVLFIYFLAPAMVILMLFSWLVFVFNRKIGLSLLIIGLFIISSVYAVIALDKPSDKKIIYFSEWVSDQEEFSEAFTGFKEGLENKGYPENSYIIEKRTADLDFAKQEEIAKEIALKNPDLVFSLTTPGTIEILEQTDDIPVIFSIVTYPAEVGIVQSLLAPGGNATGTRNWVSARQQIDTFLSVYPQARSIGFVHRESEPNSEIQFNEFKTYLDQKGVELVRITSPSAEGLSSSLEESKGQIDAIYSACDTLIQGAGSPIVRKFAGENQFPDFSCGKYDVLSGALVSQVADFNQIGKIAGEQAGDVLDGIPVGAIDVQSSPKPLTYINLLRAQELNLNVPDSLLNEAEEVIR